MTFIETMAPEDRNSMAPRGTLAGFTTCGSVQ